jgi:hypothetical protein
MSARLRQAEKLRNRADVLRAIAGTFRVIAKKPLFDNFDNMAERCEATAADLERSFSSDMRVAMEASQSMSRNCLLCKQPFTSAWAGQRICPTCRTGETEF